MASWLDFNAENSQWLAATTLISVTVWSAWYHYRRFLESKRPFEGMPVPPNSHWFAGHIYLFQQAFRYNNSSLVTQYANEHGQVSFWLGPRKTLMVTHAEDARTVLSTEYFRTTPPWITKHAKMFLGSKNIGLLHGREWKVHRSAITKAVGTESALNQARVAVVQVAEQLVASLRQRLDTTPVMDVEPLMKMVTIDVFAQTTLSTELNCCKTLTPSPIAEAFDSLLVDLGTRITNALKPSLMFYWFPTARNIRHYRHRTLLRGFLAKLLQDRVNALEGKEAATTSTKKDVLTTLFQAHKDSREASQINYVSNETLNDTLMALLFAGYDTTSTTLTYALYCISQHPDVERNCLEEIVECKSFLEGDLSQGLIYCRAVLQETLRLYPPGGQVTRVLQKPVKIKGGFVIPTGTRIFIPIEHIQRQERHFPEATTFQPERWVQRRTVDDGTAPSKWKEREDVNHKAFLAFSAGGRACPGAKFAMQEASIVLAVLMRTFRFQALDDYKLEPVRTGIVQRPKGGMPMKISLRVQ